MFPKTSSKYSISTVNKYYEDIIQVHHFDLASVSKNSILIILKATEVLKAATLHSLSGRFL